MSRTFLSLGALFAFLAVGLGAFGAHALKDRISPDMLAVYQTGVQYQMAHALALVLLGIIGLVSNARINLAGWLFTAGIALFSGSLYALALSGVRVFGAITPLGGVCFLSGWLVLARAANSLPRESSAPR